MIPKGPQEGIYGDLKNSFRKKGNFAQKGSWIRNAKGCYHWDQSVVKARE